jgi:hypothetical protein
MLLPYTYIATDIDEAYQEEYSQLLSKQARLYARSWFQCYTKIKHFHPGLLARAHLNIERIIYDNRQAINKEDLFVDYVVKHLGGLDDEFGDYSLDLGDKVEDLIAKCPDTDAFNNHIFNRFTYFTKQLARITATFANSPYAGANKARELKAYLDVA